MKKRLMAMLCACATVLCLATPTYAANSEYPGSASDTQSCLVSAEVGSSYSVSIPAALTLAKSGATTTYTGTYNVGVKGNIAADKKVTLKPNAASFTMTDTTDGTNTATASVAQTKTNWMNTISNASTDSVIGDTSYATISGTVSVDLPVAGSYSGTMTFAYSITDI